MINNVFLYRIPRVTNPETTFRLFRGPVLHMDIKSKNIVLDSQFNARLIDFGIARELKEDAETLLVTSTNYGTPGYYSTVPQIVVKKQNDYHNFGVGKYFPSAMHFKSTLIALFTGYTTFMQFIKGYICFENFEKTLRLSCFNV